MSKSDNIAVLMQLLLSKFDKQSEKFDSFDVKLNEIKNEIKIGHDKLIKQCDKVITKLNENLMQLEKQKVNSSENSTKNEVLTNKVNNNDNVNNAFTGSKNIILENDNESIMSDNEAVSYTHLDVYKRQGVDMLKTKFG